MLWWPRRSRPRGDDTPPTPPMKIIARLSVSFALVFAAQLSAQTGLQFNLGGPGEVIQDRFIFANNGVTATATAWSADRTETNPVLHVSEVVQWSPGIGVKNASETITDVPYVPYYVDNQNHYDFILFVFSAPVDISSVRLNPSAGTFDLDASYWLGNIDPAANLSGRAFTGLAGLGFGPRINSESIASNTSRDVAINTPAGGVNAILFGARVSGDAEFDRFKISTIQGCTVIPEPGTAALLLGSLLLVAGRRRR